MRFSIFMFLGFLLVCLSNSKYLIQSFHTSSSCSESTLLTLWLFPLPSLCTDKPFGEKVIYDYNETKGNVYYSTFLETNCTGLNTTFSYKTGQCHSLKKGDSMFYINFTVTDILPFNRSLSKRYYVQENFQDPNCQVPVDGTVTTGVTSFVKKLDPVHLNDAIFGDSLIYCEDNWVVEELYDSNYSIIDSWKYFPQMKTGECLTNFNSTLFVHSQYKSIIPKCMNESQFDSDIKPQIPLTSDYKYQLLNSHYDSNCSMAYYIKPWYLDICNHQKSTSRVTGDSIYHIKFVGGTENNYCNDGELYRVDIHKSFQNGSSFFSSCDYVGIDSLYSDMSNYLERVLVNDVHYPNHIAIIATAKGTCDDFSVVEEIKKNPGTNDYFSYIQEGKCIGGHEKEGDTVGLSFSGECVKGKIEYNEYLQSDHCYGLFIESDKDWCTYLNSRTVGFDPTSAYKYFYTCVPRYCGEYSEFDPLVCSSRRGECGIGGICLNCKDSYFGDQCESFNCYGINKDLTDKVCSGKGECSKPDICDCQSGNHGLWCQKTQNVVGTVLGVVFGVSLPLICLAFLAVTLVILICCILLIGCGFLFFLIVSFVTAISIQQKIRLSKFGELDDFEMVLSEQKAEKRSSHAHLKINKKLFEVPFEDVVIEKLIGEGGSDAKVFLADWGGQKVAFKCFKITKLCTSQDRFNHFEAEVGVLASLSHPNIIRFFGASLKPPRIGILMEYCSKGEILKFIIFYRRDQNLKKEKQQQGGEVGGGGYPVSEKLRMCREIVSALKYIHSKNIIHRDLKPDNILLDSNLCCKLMDFGISKVVESTEGEKTRRIGTRSYMAPEIISGKYSELCDVYSFAVLAYTLFSENPHPYGTENTTNTAIEFRVANDSNFRPNLKDIKLSFGNDKKSYQWMREVISKCWNGDPSKRFNSTELLGVFENESQFQNREFERLKREEIEALKDDDGDLNNEALIGLLREIIGKVGENDANVIQKAILKIESSK